MSEWDREKLPGMAGDVHRRGTRSAAGCIVRGSSRGRGYLDGLPRRALALAAAAVIFCGVHFAAAQTAPAAVPESAPLAASVSAPAAGSASSQDIPQGRTIQLHHRSRRDESASSESSSDAPADAIPPTKPFSSDFSILLTRSLFLKGRPPAMDSGESRHGGGDGEDDTPASIARREEAALVFDGVTDADGEPVAFVENTGSAEIKLLKVGDPVAAGKITAISLDTLEYTAGDRTVTVGIGQNFRGDSVVAAPPVAPAAPPSAGADASGATPGGPAGAGDAGPAGPAPDAGTPGANGVAVSPPAVTPDSGAGADILERLRKRRLQELSGGK